MEKVLYSIPLSTLLRTVVTVICVSPCYVYPHTHIPSDMCIPGGGTINTDAHPRHNKEISSLAKENAVDII